METLVTGTSSGLGAYLLDFWQSEGASRDENGNFRAFQNDRYPIIVHCAANSGKSEAANSIDQRLTQSKRILNQLTEIECELFVFLSSIDVYPQHDLVKSEDIPISTDECESIYSIEKLIGEEILKSSNRTCLILRCGSLIGAHARPSNLIRLAHFDDPQLSLTPDSSLSLITHQQVRDFIEFAYANRVSGSFNLVSNNSISLKDAAKVLGKEPKYGEFQYTAPVASNKKVNSICSIFDKTSETVLEEFAATALQDSTTSEGS